MDFPVQTTLEGYIIEFVKRTINIFPRLKKYLKKVLEEDCCGKYPLWIKILLVEEGMFHVFSLTWQRKPLLVGGVI
jgi:hypothetical protein